MAAPLDGIRKTKGAYHHGDLKAALIEAAAVILETRGFDALSLRAAARRAGVSEAAPYRHFADKAALLSAVIDAARSALCDEIASAMNTYRGEGRPALRAGGLALLKFAIDQAGRYRLLASDPKLGSVAELFLDDAGSWDHAQKSLALYHGLAMLVLTGALDPDDAQALLLQD
jgi:AcrR family transcriptional regulator